MLDQIYNPFGAEVEWAIQFTEKKANKNKYPLKFQALLYVLISEEYLFLDDISKADEFAQKALESDKQSFMPYAALARVFCRKKEYQKAKAAFQKAIELAPECYKERLGAIQKKLE